jgi:hypothetical protein
MANQKEVHFSSIAGRQRYVGKPFPEDGSSEAVLHGQVCHAARYLSKIKLEGQGFWEKKKDMV